MKKLTIKLSALHEYYNVSKYESEFLLDDDIFVESLDGEYVKINALVKKHTEMLECEIDTLDLPYVCAKKHIIMTPTGWDYMENATEVIDKFGNILKVNSKKELGFQDSYDISLDNPHLYVTSNNLIHHNTFSALYKAFEEVLDKSSIYKKVIIIRSATTSREVGHLPGSLEDKTAILTQPYINICANLFNRKDAYDRLVEQKYLEFISTSYIRGLTFDDSIIIVDECQNLGWHELSTICGRIGINSKIMFCGDYRQNDLIMRNNGQQPLS